MGRALGSSGGVHKNVHFPKVARHASSSFSIDDTIGDVASSTQSAASKFFNFLRDGFDLVTAAGRCGDIRAGLSQSKSDGAAEPELSRQ